MIDIYNVSSKTRMTASLSQARYGLTATAVNNLVLFAGGQDASVSFEMGRNSNDCLGKCYCYS